MLLSLLSLLLLLLLQRQSDWFHLIFTDDRNGTFVIRDSTHGGKECPFTLTLYNERKVFNINVRIRQDGKYALGRLKDKEQVNKVSEFFFDGWNMFAYQIDFT